jgi:hypothetical protein
VCAHFSTYSADVIYFGTGTELVRTFRTKKRWCRNVFGLNSFGTEVSGNPSNTGQIGFILKKTCLISPETIKFTSKNTIGVEKLFQWDSEMATRITQFKMNGYRKYSKININEFSLNWMRPFIFPNYPNWSYTYKFEMFRYSLKTIKTVLGG